ncbi:hypothetical protein E4U42_006039 [Claviceps africana]|uniref:Myb-like domain-containing protein n=1 Tax=Claviceps africana TaxID=83212 RepID=A0A8K0J2X5_9HYPO|nr:hypothetical protein E4U42_006039 [Claviceps africana]
MSSMFKKKGGLAFKPKAPVARARPQASTAKPSPAPEPTPIPTPASIPQSTIELPQATTTEIETESEITNGESHTRSAALRGPEVTVEEEAEDGKQNGSPVASRKSTRRASHSQQFDTTSRPSIPPPGGQTAAPIDDIIEPNPVVVETTKLASRSESSNAKPSLQPSPIQNTATITSNISTNTTTTATDEATIPVEAPSATALLDESQSIPTTTGIEEAAAPLPVIRAPDAAPKQATRRKKATTTGHNISAENDEAGQSESSRPKKRQKRTTTQKQNGESRPPSAARKRKTPTPTTNGSRSSSRRARSMTPDDAETQVVDLQKLKMSDLTKDLRIGKKFSRHDELRERERKARSKTKPERDSGTCSEAGNGSRKKTTHDKASQSPGPDGTGSNAAQSSTGASTSTHAPAATSGPQFRIVDGQIVVDQDSLVMDRHARAAAAQAGEDMETIEENDFTRLITSSSFMNTSKLKGPNIWTEPETELFYRGLRMFGTEFEMISKMFPGKQRRHIKLKFNREERHNPERIDAAVMGEKTIKMDLDEYRAFTGAEFEPVEDIEAEQRKIQEGYEAERQRVADEQAEIMRKKREELFADDDADVSGRKKKGKRKGRQAVSYGLNGEPILQGG